MTKKEFTEELEIILNEESGSLNESSLLADIAGWDSSGMLGIVAFFDGELNVRVGADTLRACETISDLIKLVEKNLTN